MLALLMQVGVPPPTCGTAGWMLENLDGKEYGVEFVCRGGEAVITLQLLEGRKADGLPIWKTIAQRKIALANGDGLLEGGTCNLKGSEPDAEIVLHEGWTGENHPRLPRQPSAQGDRTAPRRLGGVRSGRGLTLGSKDEVQGSRCEVRGVESSKFEIRMKN